MMITDKDLCVYTGKADAEANASRFIDAIGQDLTVSKAHWLTCPLMLWGDIHAQIQRSKKRRLSEINKKLREDPRCFREAKMQFRREYEDGHCGAGDTQQIAPDWHHGVPSHPESRFEPAPGVALDHTRRFNHQPTRHRVVITQPYSEVMFNVPTNIIIHGETTDLVVWDMPASLSTWNPNRCIVRVIAPSDTLNGYLYPALQTLLSTTAADTDDVIGGATMTRRKPVKWARMEYYQRINKENALRSLEDATPDVIETARQILPKAIDRIRDPANFCTRQLAKDEYGYPIDPSDNDARQWCATGAYLAELRRDAGQIWEDAVEKEDEVKRVLVAATTCASDFVNPAVVNDQLGHEGAIAMLERAADVLD